MLFHASNNPNATAFLTMNNKGRIIKNTTYLELGKYSTAIARNLIRERKDFTEKHILVLIPTSTEFVMALFAVFMLEAQPVVLHSPDPNRLDEDIASIISVCVKYSIDYILCDDFVEQMIKKPLASVYQANSSRMATPSLVNISHLKLSKKDANIGINPKKDSIHIRTKSTKTCTILVTADASLNLKYISFSEKEIIRFLTFIQSEYSITASKPLLSCARSHSGFGFFYGNLLSIFAGNIFLACVIELQ